MEARSHSLRPLPAGNGRIPARTLASDGLILLGAILIATMVPLVALRTLSPRPALFPYLVLASTLCVIFLARPRWIVPAFVALTWTSMEQNVFGGLPSPIEVGALAMLGYASWQALVRWRYARLVLVVAGALMIPDVAGGLLAPLGAKISVPEVKNILFLVLIALGLTRLIELDRVPIALALIGVFLGLGGLYSVMVHPTELFPLTRPAVPFAPVENRAAGPPGDPNFFALALAPLIPMGLLLIAQGGRRQVLGLVSVLCVTGGVLATGSRGGIVMVVAALVAAAFVLPVRRIRIAAIVVILAGIAALPLFAAQKQGAEGRSVEGRATENLIAIAMFEDYPLTGVGPDQYGFHYRSYSRRIGNDPRPVRAAHSLPLELAAEQGLAGLIGWLVAGTIAFRYAFRRGIWRLFLGRAIVLSIGTFMVGSLFLHGSQNRLLFMLIGLLLALAAALPASLRQQQEA